MTGRRTLATLAAVLVAWLVTWLVLPTGVASASCAEPPQQSPHRFTGVSPSSRTAAGWRSSAATTARP
jgi:hypothetical protein